MVEQNPSDAEIYSLISDVGATNARLQLIKFSRTSQRATVIKNHFYLTKTYPTISGCIHDFLEEFKGTEKYPKNATLAMAGGPLNNKLSMVNCHFPEIDGDALAEEFNIKPFTLINDFEAVGYAFFKLSNQNILTLHQAQQVRGTIGIAGTGSGLGLVVLQPIKTPEGKFTYKVFPSEGGNRDFAAIEPIDWEYLQFCLKEIPEIKELGRLSSETSFGGLGVPYIYKFFCHKEGVEAKEMTSKQIFAEADKGDALCLKVKHFHAKLFGRELSNFACNTLPYGGIYLIGNWVNALADYLINDPACPFMKAFIAKDPVTNAVLKRMPIYIITEEKELGLLGAFAKAQMDFFGADAVETNTLLTSQ